MAVIVRNFTEFGSFVANYVKKLKLYPHCDKNYSQKITVLGNDRGVLTIASPNFFSKTGPSSSSLFELLCNTHCAANHLSN